MSIAVDRSLVWSRIAVAEDTRVKEEQRWDRRLNEAKNPEEEASLKRCRIVTSEAQRQDSLKALFTLNENPPLTITARLRVEKSIETTMPRLAVT